MSKMKSIAQIVEQAAIDRWGKDYMAELVREYCRLENLETPPGSKPCTPKNRRSLVARFFDKHNCTGDTLFRLLEAVGCEFQVTRKL
jgi:hypothetical protein